MPTGKHLCRWSFRSTGGPATCRSGPCSSRTGGSTATSSPHRPALQTICGRRGTAAAAHALQAGSAPPASTRRARSAWEGGGADKPSPIFSYSLQARCLTRPGRRATATPPAARVMTPAGGRPARTPWHRRRRCSTSCSATCASMRPASLRRACPTAPSFCTSSPPTRAPPAGSQALPQTLLACSCLHTCGPVSTAAVLSSHLRSCLHTAGPVRRLRARGWVPSCRLQRAAAAPAGGLLWRVGRARHDGPSRRRQRERRRGSRHELRRGLEVHGGARSHSPVG